MYKNRWSLLKRVLHVCVDQGMCGGGGGGGQLKAQVHTRGGVWCVSIMVCLVSSP